MSSIYSYLLADPHLPGPTRGQLRKKIYELTGFPARPGQFIEIINNLDMPMPGKIGEAVSENLRGGNKNG